MFAYNIDYFLALKTQLIEIVKMALEHSEHSIKLAAIECIGAFVESAEFKESKAFEPLLLSLFNATWIMMQKDETNGQSAL